jgi:hypothetical protein
MTTVALYFDHILIGRIAAMVAAIFAVPGYGASATFVPAHVIVFCHYSPPLLELFASRVNATINMVIINKGPRPNKLFT